MSAPPPPKCLKTSRIRRKLRSILRISALSTDFNVILKNGQMVSGEEFFTGRRCSSEKRFFTGFTGCHRLGDFLEAVKQDFTKAAVVYQQNCDTTKYPKSCFKIGNYRMIGRGRVTLSLFLAELQWRRIWGCRNFFVPLWLCLLFPHNESVPQGLFLRMRGVAFQGSPRTFLLVLFFLLRQKSDAHNFLPFFFVSVVALKLSGRFLHV